MKDCGWPFKRHQVPRQSTVKPQFQNIRFVETNFEVDILLWMTWTGKAEPRSVAGEANYGTFQVAGAALYPSGTNWPWHQ